MDIVDWIIEELKTRDWTQADLARKSRLSRATVSKIINRQSIPLPDTCRAIARAFSVSDEYVMQLAGHLSAAAETSQLIEEILHELGGLDVTDQDDILGYIRLRKQIAEKRTKS